MKKQLLLLVLFMGLFGAANAQDDKKMFLGLDLGFSSDDGQSSFNLGPQFGYWLSDRMALVVGIEFGSETDKSTATELTSSNFGANAELRYGWNVGDNTFLYLAPGFSFGSRTHELSPTIEAKSSSFAIGITPGFSYMIADSWSINAEFGNLGYVSTKPDGGESAGTFGLNLTMSSIGFGVWYHF